MSRDVDNPTHLCSPPLQAFMPVTVSRPSDATVLVSTSPWSLASESGINQFDRLAKNNPLTPRASSHWDMLMDEDNPTRPNTSIMPALGSGSIWFHSRWLGMIDSQEDMC
ncbi:hypothetical protein ASPVEDRAFT_429659 [Aspergillus versicolor CBS 583.65]|uniref:Uncharacterized protein n=1 Tax=Aspergillus versicolor CBS 583.65 TaxID=1036611 RepID=A0A1L9P8H4_ASPVE|nr:uncharacterized protein ASPVEDRAFT_429659 [Aspergillus versicolor CBS 583.65]OJI97798.1 hypothetical protein ASPVEDRAFT_429659 [Aspergillus versicolor CBS 583.65]